MDLLSVQANLFGIWCAVWVPPKVQNRGYGLVLVHFSGFESGQKRLYKYYNAYVEVSFGVMFLYVIFISCYSFLLFNYTHVLLSEITMVSFVWTVYLEQKINKNIARKISYTYDKRTFM